jgi:hypothetical protein
LQLPIFYAIGTCSIFRYKVKCEQFIKGEEPEMKRIMFACFAAVAFVAPAVAGGAEYQLKAGPGNYTGTAVDPVTGNPVAYYSSDATGNGGVVGGNGSAWNGSGSPDQTTTPGSRAAAIQALLATVGKGSGK